METNLQYLSKSNKQLLTWFKTKSRENKSDFRDYEEFKTWYFGNEKKCHYCGLLESQSQEIVLKGKLKSKRFPQSGKYGRGTCRGMWLEIDRYDPNENYKVGNIVFACYFCNNDKSDIFHGDEYKIFKQDRFGFLKKLLVALLFMGFGSCKTLDGDTISENEAKEITQKKIHEHSKGLIELLDFKKNDGVKKEMFGQKAYSMSFHLRLQCKENAHQYFLLDQSFIFESDAKLQKTLKLGSAISKGDYKNYLKGEIIEYDSENLFNKTENGWNY